MQKEPTHQNETSPYLTLNELVAYLKISRASIRRLMKARRIPFVALALSKSHDGQRSHPRFDRRRIDKWMTRMEVKDFSSAYAQAMSGDPHGNL